MYYLNEKICIILNATYKCEYVAIHILLNKHQEKIFFRPATCCSSYNTLKSIEFAQAANLQGVERIYKTHKIFQGHIYDEGSLPEIALSCASKLASTYFTLFYRSVHVLYTEICILGGCLC